MSMNDWLRAQAKRHTIPANAPDPSAAIRAIAGRSEIVCHDVAPLHPMNAAIRKLTGAPNDAA